MLHQEPIKIEQQIEWKRHYHLIELQRCYLARYSLMKHVYVEEEEKRMKQALIGTVLFFGMLSFWCFL